MRKVRILIMMTMISVLVVCYAGWAMKPEVQPDPVVKQAQERLKELGYKPGTIDGKIDPKTEEAIKQFQADNKLEITGKLDKETLKELGISGQPKETEINTSGAKIRTQDKSVDISTPGATVEVGDGDVDISTPGATVEVGDGDVDISTPGATVSVGTGGISIDVGPEIDIDIEDEDLDWGDTNIISEGGEPITDIANIPNLPEMPEGLAESQPIVYKGYEDATISNRSIRTGGDGIILNGVGDVEIVNCYIIAGKTGIKVLGNSDVKIKNCFILGGNAALISGGNADVSVSNTTFRGRVIRQGNADFNDEGGNIFE